jgi:hypothetical protein
MILTKEDLAKYLKYGWVSDYDYPKPKKKTKVNYKSLVNELEYLCLNSIRETNILAENPIYLLSGGVDSSLVVSQVNNAKTFTIKNWNTRDIPWALKASNILSTTYMDFETQDEFLEEDLVKIQSWFSKPYSLLLGFFWFLTAKELVRNGFYCFVDGNGPDHAMMEDHGNSIIARASFLNQYDFHKAKEYLISSFLREISESNKIILKFLKREQIINSYIESLPINQFRIIFDDSDVSKFGLEPFKLELRNETIDDIDQLLFHIKEESADLFYKMIENTLGCKSYHPLRRQDILDICMETPYEIKNALGFQKLPFREICNKWVNYEIAARPKLDWTPKVPSRNNWMIGDWDFNYPINLESFKSLIDKYLGKKDRKLYNYLDYDLVVPYYSNQPPGITRFSRQIWNLLNLSVWLECHDD